MPNNLKPSFKITRTDFAKAKLVFLTTSSSALIFSKEQNLLKLEAKDNKYLAITLGAASSDAFSTV